MKLFITKVLVVVEEEALQPEEAQMVDMEGIEGVQRKDTIEKDLGNMNEALL